MAIYQTNTQLPTYRAATTANVVAAAGADIFFVIEGSASKDVLVRKIVLSGPTLTAVAYNSLVVEKFSTAASGGTATNLTKTPLDSKFDAATVNSCKVYTAAPTEGTLVGTVAARRILMEATTAAAGAAPPAVEFDFTTFDGGGVILRGTAQGLGAAFGAAPATAVTLAVEVEWQEV